MSGAPSQFTLEELARRRRAAVLWSWLLGLAVLLIYVVGMFIPR